MIFKLPFVYSQRSKRRRCIVSHGDLDSVWFLVVWQFPVNQIEVTASKCAKSRLHHDRRYVFTLRFHVIPCASYCPEHNGRVERPVRTPRWAHNPQRRSYKCPLWHPLGLSHELLALDSSIVKLT
jgi:hypothetical protein